MRYRFFTFIYFVFSFFFLYSQKETNKWYFGNHQALDFNTNPPTIINGSALFSFEGSASMADNNGNLLFYTDGVTVWNQLNAPMANGTGLLGGIGVPGIGVGYQCALILKQPGTVNQYFVITAPAGTSTNVIYYSKIDMSLAAGMGSVTIKNVPLFNMSTGKITGVKHCNGQDYWIITHDLFSATFRCFLLTSAGINTTPVLSTIGTIHNNDYFTMKVSPNGKKLGLGIQINSNYIGNYELYDFDNSTGVVSNSLILASNIPIQSCEFSPDGTKFFGLGSYPNTAKILHQWDLCNNSNSGIVNSHYTLSTNYFGELQLASNGKIYHSDNGSYSLSVITNPNNYGSSINYSQEIQSCGTNTNTANLPNFVCSYFRQAKQFDYNYGPTANCLTPSFVAVPCPYASPPVQSVQWNFGDAASGNNNFSTFLNASHSYPNPGNYSVQCIIHFNCYTDTLNQVINIPNFSPNLFISGNYSICLGQSATLTASGAGSYTWSNNSNAATQILSPTLSTIYNLSATGSSNNCVSSQTILVTVFPNASVVISPSRTLTCTGETLSLLASGASSYTWNPGALTGSNVALSPMPGQNFTLTAKDLNGCDYTSTFKPIVSYCASISQFKGDNQPIKIKPNPNNGRFIISSTCSTKILVYNLMGELIYETVIEIGDTEIDLSYLRDNVYVLKSLNLNDTQIFKMIISK